MRSRNALLIAGLLEAPQLSSGVQPLRGSGPESETQIVPGGWAVAAPTLSLANVEVAARVQYYMGIWYDRKVWLQRSDFPDLAQMDRPFIFNRSSAPKEDGSVCRHLALANQRYRFLRGTCTNYENDLAEAARAAGIDRLGALVMFGDISSGLGIQQQQQMQGGVPLLVKTRTLDHTANQQTGILMQVNSKRHWHWLSEPKAAEPVWSRKKEGLVWRGSTTGLSDNLNVRYWYVSSLYADHDVGFSQGVQGRSSWAEPPPNGFGRPRMDMGEQMQYKYLLSLEGNDVATDLKWKLASGSVVMMPPPTKEGWLMEGRLQPWVHYIPLDGPADVPRKLEWARTHQEWCEGIAANATQYMQQFIEPQREKDILNSLLLRYQANVEWL